MRVFDQESEFAKELQFVTAHIPTFTPEVGTHEAQTEAMPLLRESYEENAPLLIGDAAIGAEGCRVGQDDLMDVIHAAGDIDEVARIFFPHFAEAYGGRNEEVLEEGIKGDAALEQGRERCKRRGGVILKDCICECEHLTAEGGGVGLRDPVAVNQTRNDVGFDQVGQCPALASWL